MNHQLIKKLIIANQQTCPQFIYSNPALDIKIAREISKCFVKLFTETRENDSDMLRMTILETVRNLCKCQPSDHVDIDEYVTELLIDISQKHLHHSELDIDKQLDAFLIQTSKDVTIEPHFKEPNNPEVVKALMNLNKGKDLLYILSKSVIHWGAEDARVQIILKELWDQHKSEPGISESLSMKVQPDIERILLENSLAIVENKKCDVDDDFTQNNDLSALIQSCSDSPNCFQICISILNSIFILSNFNSRIGEFIQTFVYSVKNKFKNLTFSVLYPPDLTHVTTLLDFDLDQIIQEGVKNKYKETTLKYLKTVNKQSEYNLIMLLSHFPQWFNIYFQMS